jgi:magnesium chelatase family protein
MNPCRCGHLGDAALACSRAPRCAADYQARVSGPLLDRIDLHLSVPAVPYRELTGEQREEPSAAVRARVERARRVQQARFRHRPGIHANAHMLPRDLRTHCRLSPAAEQLLRAAIQRLGLSARAYHRVLKIARTIADLDSVEELSAGHVGEAVQYRTLDRRRLPVAASA